MIEWSVSAIRAAVRSGQVSAEEVTRESLRRIEQGAHLHTFLTVCPEHALEQARSVDQCVAGGGDPGPMAGVPFSVKDVYASAGVRTTYGSLVYADHVPEADDVVVARMRAAGGVLVGKTNTPEFAVFIRTVNRLQPESRNPWDPKRTTGGSSGGAAASTAMGMTPVAIGSDGGGSTRIPAALCGMVGVMPSRGSVPRGGYIGTRRFSASGPITPRADDAREVLRVLAGASETDPLSRGLAPVGVRHASKPPWSLRWVGDSGVPVTEDAVVELARERGEDLARLTGGAWSEPGESMQAPRFTQDFYAIMQADRYSTGGADLLADPATAAQLTHYARHHFEVASTITGAQYSAAVETQLAAVEHLLHLLGDADFLATPTVGIVAPEIPASGEQLPEDARRGFVAFTYLVNYTGFAAITIPCGVVAGMPVGLQLIGRPGSESALLDLAGQFQESISPPMTCPVPPEEATDEH